ncbi:hypothetical protein U8527_15825 [Kordia algicida OT-1]|uniref:Ribonuclease Z n=1 Tax=Kordia algicida OT-1 TaxID=391587 RepID=A9E3Y2_9FLAO|nr:hypothetical protein [Kordia algicida]EDP95288.1 ribonuclease Z [Kordia algicida OT-1]
MRTELETIASIEKYILNVLSETETKAFETRMATDSDFKNDVELQQQLVHSLERISLQKTIQNAHKTYLFWKLLKLIGMIVIPLLLALLSWYFWNASAETTQQVKTIPTNVEQQISTEKEQETSVIKEMEEEAIPKKTSIEKPPVITPNETTVFAENIVVNPADEITSEVFSILIEKDTIVETKNGIVFLIPEHAFVDKNQNIINGNVQLEVKEAIDSHTIMTAGLATFFNDKPLETGGMFFIEATQNGQKLKINPQKEIIADIPTQNYKEGMQLFDGEVLEDGTINWTNPKSLHNTLIPQDIYSLNFYPPKYLETLAEKGYDISNKKFTDSLYYSFGDVSKKAVNHQTIGEYIEEETNKDRIRFQDTIKTDYVIVSSKDSVKTNRTEKKVVSGLDPLKVKAIWNERFQNTFIATKAFEERLRAIHKNCRTANYMLNTYLENLDRDLYISDSIIAYSTNGEAINMPFLEFSKQKLTNVPNANSEVSKLNDYYLQQQKVYRLALQETQQKIDSLLDVNKKYQAFSKQQLQNYYNNELAITTDRVSKSLAVRLPRRFNRTNTVSGEVSTKVTSVATIIKKERKKRVYRAPIRTTGWKNIDRVIDEQLISSVQNRTTTTIRNNQKSVTITYADYEVSIENTQRFDKLFVYLVPTEFNSFVRLKAENGRFTYKLNDLLTYRVYCVAYLNTVPFYFEKTIKNTSDKIKLREITETILREKLANITTENRSLETEIIYQTTRKTNDKTLKKYRELVKLKKEIENVVFPCRQSETVNSITFDALETTQMEVSIVDFIEEIPFGTVEESPSFPNYNRNTTETEKKTDFENAVKNFIRENFNMNIIDASKYPENEFRISFSMRIDTSGVMRLTFIGSKDDAVRKEVNRIATLFPKVTPGKQNGIPVNVSYAFSIVFTL